jgi:hypothetical protein
VLIIVLKVDETLEDVNWWLILLPTIVYAFFNCALFVAYRLQASKESAKLDELMAAPIPGSLKEHQENEFKRTRTVGKKERLKKRKRERDTCCVCYTK